MTARNAEFESMIAPLELRMIQATLRVLRCVEDAEDAYQHALLCVWKRMDEVKVHPNPPALIMRICLQEAVDVLRKRTRRRRWLHLWGDVDLDETAYESSAPSACESLQRREMRREVLREISRLPQKQSVAVLMRYVDESHYDEIAAALGCSETTARSHVALARAKLAKKLSHLIQEDSTEVKSDEIPTTFL